MGESHPREGLFWDVVEGRKPMHPSGELIGWKLLDVDPEAGTIRVQFYARPEFGNPVGTVQGGLLAAMLDETMGPALVATMGPGEFAPTIELKVNLIRPARVGSTLTGEGRIVHRGGSIAFLASELRDEDGALIATATATARLNLAKPSP